MLYHRTVMQDSTELFKEYPYRLESDHVIVFSMGVDLILHHMCTVHYHAYMHSWYGAFFCLCLLALLRLRPAD